MAALCSLQAQGISSTLGADLDAISGIGEPSECKTQTVLQAARSGLRLLLLCTGRAHWSGGTVTSFKVLGELPSLPRLGLGCYAKGSCAIGMELPSSPPLL